ncbi:MAG: hypothetical protein PWQ20_1421 [Thermotogaceae bacterium]|nr:hypothetical protein [Thermotogaceae bacterium]
MKIFIDGSFYKGTGIGRYYSNLLKLVADKTDWEIYTTVPILFKKDWLSEFGKYCNVRPVFTKHGRFNLKSLYQTGKVVRELEKNGCKVFWFPHVNLPFYVPKNTIVTVHDLCPLTAWWERNVLTKYLFLLFLKKSTEKSKLIVVPSKATRDELLKKFPQSKEKVKVIYNFLSPEFVHKCSQKTEPIIKEDYILFVGNRKKHKNLRNLILAYSLIKDEINCKLVIAGGKDKGKKVDEIDRLIEEKGLSDYVIQIISPSDEVIINLYQHAKLFVFPSFYEGFGYPPLEALACGCPVITSNIPVLREILGDEIAVFDPRSVDEIALSIKEILLQGKPKSFQNTLFKSFSSYRLGNLYLNLIQQLEDSNTWKE